MFWLGGAGRACFKVLCTSECAFYVNDIGWGGPCRWVLNYAPDVLMAGVGQSTTNSEIYGSPQIGVFMQVRCKICCPHGDRWDAQSKPSAPLGTAKFTDSFYHL